MVVIEPIFNQSLERPYRWALRILESGESMDRYWLPEEHYTHWTEKAEASYRDVFTTISPYSYGNFIPMRRKTIGFLTTYHKDMYEDGKYTEVYNDPLNFIIDDSSNYDDAFFDAEQRIGNYRMGVRRHIIHLGGTLSEDELDMLEDIDGDPLISFPLVPPVPADFATPFRTKLITSDVGYIDYIKTAHSSETTTARYAYRSEQGTGFRRFIYPAGTVEDNSLIYESTTTPTISMVKIEDLESLIDTQFTSQILGTTLTKQFLPDDGEDILVNFAGQNIIRSDKNGIHLEVYDDVNFTTLISLIDIDTTTGEVYIGAGTTDITITKDGAITLDDGTRSIVLGGTNIVMTNGSRSITILDQTVNVS